MKSRMVMCPKRITGWAAAFLLRRRASRRGQVVLDLGSGAGNDVFVARRIVGESGKAIGLDFTEAMVKQANINKAKLGYENVDFILGDIEAIPLPDNHVDVIISNCVLNLVPNKEKAFGEAYRVLNPGGRFSISDIVLVGDLPPEVRKAAALYAGCVSGALPREEYLDIIKKCWLRAGRNCERAGHQPS